MIEAESLLSPPKKLDFQGKRNHQQKDVMELQKRLEEKELIIYKLQKQLNEANRLIMVSKNEHADWEKKFERQEDYILKCQAIIRQYEQSFQQSKSGSQEKRLMLPNIANNLSQQDLSVQGTNLHSQKKKNQKLEQMYESATENKNNNSRFMQKHFETSAESLSAHDVTSPRNLNEIELQPKYSYKDISNSSQKMIKSEQKPLKTDYFFEDQRQSSRNKQSHKHHGINKSMIQSTVQNRSQEGQHNEKQPPQYQQAQQQYGSQSCTRSNQNKKQYNQGQQLRNSLQDIYLNFNGMYQGNRMAANNLENLPNFFQGNSLLQQYPTMKDNIFSKYNKIPNHHLKHRKFESSSNSQINSTPDLSLIKLPISKLQKVHSKEIKRRINQKIESQFNN